MMIIDTKIIFHPEASLRKDFYPDAECNQWREANCLFIQGLPQLQPVTKYKVPLQGNHVQ
jgi:hypothetical protein